MDKTVGSPGENPDKRGPEHDQGNETDFINKFLNLPNLYLNNIVEVSIHDRKTYEKERAPSADLKLIWGGRFSTPNINMDLDAWWFYLHEDPKDNEQYLTIVKGDPEPCAFCEKGNEGDHRECAEAWGLDHDPESQEEAKQWLEERREKIKHMLATREICRHCKVDAAKDATSMEKCSKCLWPGTIKYPTEYDGPKFRSTAALREVRK